MSERKEQNRSRKRVVKLNYDLARLYRRNAVLCEQQAMYHEFAVAYIQSGSVLSWEEWKAKKKNDQDWWDRYILVPLKEYIGLTRHNNENPNIA